MSTFEKHAAEIADACKGRWDASVTTADTRGWVCSDAMQAWIDSEVGLRSPQSIIAEVASRLTDAQAVTLLRSLGHDLNAVHDPLFAALEGVVTSRMVEAAEEIINNPPTSRAELKKLAAASVAAHRTGREHYFDV